MLKIQRLNMDNTWWLNWGNTSLLLDPWLTGSEIDGFRWFNEQWHNTPPVHPGQVPGYDFVIVTQPYSDHCHSSTLRELNTEKPVWAVPAALKRIKKEMAGTKGFDIPAATEVWADIGELKLARITPKRWIDPIYHAVVIEKQGEAVVYAPHGFALDGAQASSIRHLKIKLLITTFTEFTLPFFLGGLINRGKEDALKLMKQLNAEHVVNTHDEDKRANGIVIKLAKRKYPDMSSLSSTEPGVVNISDYKPVSFG